jgi:hypothetical protein
MAGVSLAWSDERQALDIQMPRWVQGSCIHHVYQVRFAAPGMSSKEAGLKGEIFYYTRHVRVEWSPCIQ